MLNNDIYKLPNLVSAIRLLMAPFLLVLAINQKAEWYLVVLVFTVFTDVLDGFLARHLNQITELGSHLDSWGDFAVYTVMAISAYLLWPEIVAREALFFTLILLSFTLPVLIGLIKFHRLTSYHTWSVKAAVALTIVSYILLFTGLYSWPFHLAAIVCVYAALEEIIISILLKDEKSDVRSVWHALQLK